MSAINVKVNVCLFKCVSVQHFQAQLNYVLLINNFLFSWSKKNIPALKTALNVDFLILHTPEVNVMLSL